MFFFQTRVTVALMALLGTIQSATAAASHRDEAAPQQLLRKRAGETIGPGGMESRQVPEETKGDLNRVFMDSLFLQRYLEGESSMPSSNLKNDPGPSTTTSSKQPPWPHEKADIALDPEVVLGELDNGLRYQLRRNTAPANRLELRLHVDAGANMEEDDELGLAHFLEHLAFRTLRNFPEGSITTRFQRLGLGAGSHVNAYTNFHEVRIF